MEYNVHPSEYIIVPFPPPIGVGVTVGVTVGVRVGIDVKVLVACRVVALVRVEVSVGLDC